MLCHTWVQKLLGYLDNRDVYKKIELGKARARHKKVSYMIPYIIDEYMLSLKQK